MTAGASGLCRKVEQPAQALQKYKLISVKTNQPTNLNPEEISKLPGMTISAAWLNNEWLRVSTPVV